MCALEKLPVKTTVTLSWILLDGYCRTYQALKIRKFKKKKPKHYMTMKRSWILSLFKHLVVHGFMFYMRARTVDNNELLPCYTKELGFYAECNREFTARLTKMILDLHFRKKTGRGSLTVRQAWWSCQSPCQSRSLWLTGVLHIPYWTVHE